MTNASSDVPLKIKQPTSRTALRVIFRLRYLFFPRSQCHCLRLSISVLLIGATLTFYHRRPHISARSRSYASTLINAKLTGFMSLGEQTGVESSPRSLLIFGHVYPCSRVNPKSACMRPYIIACTFVEGKVSKLAARGLKAAELP